MYQSSNNTSKLMETNFTKIVNNKKKIFNEFIKLKDNYILKNIYNLDKYL